MKKSRILNSHLNNAIADLGHGDTVIICDAGYPIPDKNKRVDLAIEKDIPGIAQVMELMISDFIYEEVVVAEEQKAYNPVLFARITELATRCPVKTVPHTEIIGSYRDGAKYYIRTGGFEPWGNVVLRSGVDAPVWFEKPGTIAPDYYQDRANYKEQE